MSLWIVVPAKALARGKSRLAAVLCDADRQALSRRFLDRTLATAACCVPLSVIQVVSDGADTLDYARAQGVGALAQSGSGLNQALGEAREIARRAGIDTLLVLPSDLPFLAVEDIEHLIDVGAGPGLLAIARDGSRRGTNALVLPSAAAFRFRFGPDSAAAHAAEARRRGWRVVTVDRPRLAFDVDTPGDYAAFVARDTAD